MASGSLFLARARTAAAAPALPAVLVLVLEHLLRLQLLNQCCTSESGGTHSQSCAQGARSDGQRHAGLGLVVSVGLQTTVKQAPTKTSLPLGGSIHRVELAVKLTTWGENADFRISCFKCTQYKQMVLNLVQ